MANKKKEIKMKYVLKDIVGIGGLRNDVSLTSVLEKLQECGYTEQEAYDIWTIASYGYDMPDPFPRELLVQYRKMREKLIEEKEQLFGRLYGYDPNIYRDEDEVLEIEIYEQAEFEASASLKLPGHPGFDLEAAVKAAMEELDDLEDTDQDG